MNWDGLVKLVESLKGFVLIVGVLIGSFILSWRGMQTASDPLIIAVYWLGFTSTLVTYYFFNRGNTKQGKVIDDAVQRFSDRFEDALSKLDDPKN